LASTKFAEVTAEEKLYQNFRSTDQPMCCLATGSFELQTSSVALVFSSCSMFPSLEEMSAESMPICRFIVAQQHTALIAKCISARLSVWMRDLFLRCA